MNIKTFSWIVIGLSLAVIVAVLLFRPAAGPAPSTQTGTPTPPSSVRVETAGKPVFIDFYTDT